MAIYIVGLCLALSGGAFGMLIKGEKKKYATFFSFLPIFFITAVRYGIGTDYQNYVNILNGIKFDVPALYGYSLPEPLYVLINKIVIWLNLDNQWLFVINAFIYCFVVFYVIYDISPKPLMSVFLLFGTTIYFASLNEMRQHLGCAILLLAIKYAYERKLKRFLIVVFIAGMIHYSCFLFALIYLFNFVKFNPRKAIPAILVVVLLKDVLVNIVHTVLSGTRYESYLSHDTEEATLGLLIQLVIFVFVSVYYQDNNKYRILYGAELGCFVLTLLQGTVPLVYRVKWVVYYPLIFLVPLAMQRIKSKELKIIAYAGIVGCFLLYMYITIVVNKGYGVYPYQWIFD